MRDMRTHLATPLGLSVASAIIAISPAHSAEPTAIRTGLHPGFARLVFEWSEAVGFDRDVRDGAVVLRFDQPVTADLAAVGRQLSGYVKGLSVGSDTAAIRLDLLPGVDAEVWTADDRKVVVDLAVDRRGGSEVSMRAGRHEGYDRIVLEWPDPVTFQIMRHHRTLRIEVDRPTRFDRETLAQLTPASVGAVDTGVADDRGWVELRLVEGAIAKVSDYGDRRRIVIDIVPTIMPVPQFKPMPRFEPAPAIDYGATFVAAPGAVLSASAESTTGSQWWRAAQPRWQTFGAWLTWLVASLRAVVWEFIGWSTQPAIVQTDAAARRQMTPDPTTAPTMTAVLLPGGYLDDREDRSADPLDSPRHSRRDQPSIRAAHVPQHRAPDAVGRTLEPRALDEITAGAMDTQPDMPVPTPPGSRPESSDDPDDNPELEALNRVLVEAGGLLLPTWGIELAPETIYEYQGSAGLLITDLGDGRRTAMSQQARRDTIEAATTLRVGLPWDSQAEIRVPYRYSSEEVSIGGQSQASRTGSGIGDVAVGLSHQFLRESDWYPDLLGEVRWKTTTGDDNFDVDADTIATGSGFNAIGGSLTAVKSYDPMVFFGRLGYEANLPDKKNGVKIDPGDSLSLGMGAILSAGPGTSFRFGISQSFTGEAEVEGSSIAGTDQVTGVLQIGAAAALPNRTLLDISAGVGITDDAPDFVIRASLPYRF